MNRILVMFLIVCAPQAAQKARIDFDHAGNFSRYHTYRWAGPPDTPVLNQLMQERVVGFIEEALSARGLKRVQNGADLVISCRMDTRQQEVWTTVSDGFGWGWDAGWGNSIATTTSQVTLIGTLTVDLVDARSNQLVFEGVSSSSISSKPEHNTRKYAKSVNHIFDKYPPR